MSLRVELAALDLLGDGRAPVIASRSPAAVPLGDWVAPLLRRATPEPRAHLRLPRGVEAVCERTLRFEDLTGADHVLLVASGAEAATLAAAIETARGAPPDAVRMCGPGPAPEGMALIAGAARGDALYARDGAASAAAFDRLDALRAHVDARGPLRSVDFAAAAALPGYAAAALLAEPDARQIAIAAAEGLAAPDRAGRLAFDAPVSGCSPPRIALRLEGAATWAGAARCLAPDAPPVSVEQLPGGAAILRWSFAAPVFAPALGLSLDDAPPELRARTLSVAIDLEPDDSGFRADLDGALDLETE